MSSFHPYFEIGSSRYEDLYRCFRNQEYNMNCPETGTFPCRMGRYPAVYRLQTRNHNCRISNLPWVYLLHGLLRTAKILPVATTS